MTNNRVSFLTYDVQNFTGQYSIYISIGISLAILSHERIPFVRTQYYMIKNKHLSKKVIKYYMFSMVLVIVVVVVVVFQALSHEIT